MEKQTVLCFLFFFRMVVRRRCPETGGGTGTVCSKIRPRTSVAPAVADEVRHSQGHQPLSTGAAGPPRCVSTSQQCGTNQQGRRHVALLRVRAGRTQSDRGLNLVHRTCAATSRGQQKMGSARRPLLPWFSLRAPEEQKQRLENWWHRERGTSLTLKHSLV